MSKDPIIGNFSEHERRVYRSQDPQATAAQEAANQPGPPSNALVVGTPADFESKWEEFVAGSHNPSLYGSSERAMAVLGYLWGVHACQTYTQQLILAAKPK